MTASLLMAVVWVHFVADFIFQTDKMALNKSTSFVWLSNHVIVYSLPLLIFGWRYAVVNGVAHLMVDAATSRITSSLWKAGKRRMFFIVIGLDQAIHMTCLILTIPLVRFVWPVI